MKIKIVSIVAVLAFVSFAPMAFAQCSGHSAPQSEKPDCCGTCEKSAGEKDTGSCGDCPHAGKSGSCGAEKHGSLAGEKSCGSCEGCPHAGKSGCGAEKHGSLAGDKSGGSCEGCPHAAKHASHGKGTCPIAAKVETVMESMPSMKYDVGGVQLCCHKTAEKMAEKAHKPVKYAVGDTVYDKQSEAQVKLAALLEKKLETMQSMQYSVGGEHMSCPTTAAKVAKENNTELGYCVAGFDFAEKGEAEEVLSQCKTACDSVKMMYKIGDETYSCGKTAEVECKAGGGKMMYIVGEEEMTCPVSANLKLQEKKIRTFVETAAYASAH